MPSLGQAEGWAPVGESKSFPGELLFDHIDGGADIYFEYGFVTVVIQEYGKGDTAVSLEIYCMDDSRAAFGIYSFNRHPSLSAVEVGGEGIIHQNGLFFWQDRYYVDMHQLGSSAILGEELLMLAKAIETNIGAKPGKPAVMNLLPSEDMIGRSEVLALGFLGIDNQVHIAGDDLFGLQEGEFAAIARYKFAEAELLLIIAEYLSPEACTQAFVRFREHFLPSTESTQEPEFVIEAKPGKYHGIGKADTRLLVVANADSEENALTMLDRVSQRLEVGVPDSSAE